MDWKFNKEFQVAPGIKLTYGKKGTSMEIKFDGPNAQVEAEKLKLKLFKPFDPRDEIKSASIERLTSGSLKEFKELLVITEKDYTPIAVKLKAQTAAKLALEKRVSRLEKSFFLFLMKKKLARLQADVELIRAEVAELNEQLSLARVSLEIDSEDVYFDLYKDVRKAFSLLKQSVKKWDHTSSKATNRVAERTSATRAITRSVVDLSETHLAILQMAEPPLRFYNANGGDLFLFPGFLVVAESRGEFALIDYADLEVSYRQYRFIENEQVPADSKVVGHTWWKVNKDGSPDRRFTGNFQIPIALYGELQFASASGLNEVFCFSNCESTLLFGKALHDYVDAIKKASSILEGFQAK